MTDLDIIKEWIKLGDLRKALQELEAFTSSNKYRKFNAEFIALLSRFNNNELENRRGTIESQAYKVERNKITISVIDLIERLRKIKKYFISVSENEANLIKIILTLFTFSSQFNTPSESILKHLKDYQSIPGLLEIINNIVIELSQKEQINLDELDIIASIKNTPLYTQAQKLAFEKNNMRIDIIGSESASKDPSKYVNDIIKDTAEKIELTKIQIEKISEHNLGVFDGIYKSIKQILEIPDKKLQVFTLDLETIDNIIIILEMVEAFQLANELKYVKNDFLLLDPYHFQEYTFSIPYSIMDNLSSSFYRGKAPSSAYILLDYAFKHNQLPLKILDFGLDEFTHTINMIKRFKTHAQGQIILNRLKFFTKNLFNDKNNIISSNLKKETFNKASNLTKDTNITKKLDPDGRHHRGIFNEIIWLLLLNDLLEGNKFDALVILSQSKTDLEIFSILKKKELIKQLLNNKRVITPKILSIHSYLNRYPMSGNFSQSLQILASSLSQLKDLKRVAFNHSDETIRLREALSIFNIELLAFQHQLKESYLESLHVSLNQLTAFDDLFKDFFSAYSKVDTVFRDIIFDNN